MKYRFNSVEEMEKAEKEYYLTRDQIKVGMRVKTSQLDNIYFTYIILKDLTQSEDYLGFDDTEGTIDGVYDCGEEWNKEYTEDEDVLVVYTTPGEVSLDI